MALRPYPNRLGFRYSEEDDSLPRTPPLSIASLSHLTVRYGARTAIADLSLEIPPGCVGLLGPNGAGKTTLLKTLLGFVRPAGGRGEVLGLDIGRDGLRIRQQIGLMPESECHIPGMNGVAFVAFAGELSGMPADQALRRAHEMLEFCGLGEARYRPVDGYSTGMKQRIKLAQALVHGPKLIFLDEPTNGLDPEGRRQMLELIRDISHGKGVNVLVSSHLLPDIERTCDRVIVMKGGQVVTQGEIASLRGEGGDALDVDLKEPSPAFRAAVERRGLRVESEAGASYRVRLPEGTGSEGSGSEGAGRILFLAAREAGAQLRGYRSARRSLEDVFLESIG